MTWQVLPGRVAVREMLEVSRIILPPDGYFTTHERKRTSHRGIVVAMGSPASTKGGVLVPPEFKVGDEVLYVLDARDSVGHGSWTERNRQMIWPVTGEEVTWIAQEEVIGVFDK